jgi:hypothetical protein
MQETEIEIAQKSLSFLKTYPIYDAVAYPVSDLPYPKDTIKKILLKYAMFAQISQEERGFAGKFYILLGNFIDNEEAKFVNMMSEKVGDAPQVRSNDTKITAEWFRNLRDTDDFKRYTAVSSRMEVDRKKLKTELENMGFKFLTTVS